MRQCNKWCIANIDGECVVEHCKGEIHSMDRHSTLSHQQAAADGTAPSRQDGLKDGLPFLHRLADNADERPVLGHKSGRDMD